MTRAKDNNNATILSIGISKGRIAYQKLIGSRHVKATVPTATSHWANSQTCCMQDERLCLPLIPSFDVPFEHKKGLKLVLVRLLWHGFTETHDHVSPFCLEYRDVAWCQLSDELKTCTTLQGCVCGWHKGRRGWHIWHWWNSMKRPQSWQCFRSNASLAKRTCFINLQTMAGNSVQAACIANVSCGIWTVASACFSPPGNKKVAPPFSVLAFFGSRCCGVSNKQHVWKNGITSRFES